MAKINIVMADSDELYLNKITNYLLEKASDFEICSFTSKESMIKFITDKGNKIDVIAFSEDLLNDAISAANISVKILLTDGSYTDIKDFEILNKYQKAEKFVNDIRMIYADKTGHIEAVKTGNKNTKIVGVYSPVGGCGKTTISIALAMAIAKRGNRVFYFNCEVINSTTDLFNNAPSGNMSEVYLAMKTKGANAELKIIANKYEDPTTNITYINPAESTLELNELSISELKSLTEILGKISQFDVVIVDFDSSFDERKMEILSVCDDILMPFSPDLLSINKMSVLMNEFRIHRNLRELFNKIHLVVNKFDTHKSIELQNSNITNHKEIEASIPISSMFYDLRNLAYSNQSSQQVLNPLLNIIFKE